MINNNSQDTKKKIKTNKKKIITQKKRLNLNQNKPWWPSFIFRFSLKVLTCYLALSYFYWCPKDATQNPLVCRNLAEIHWALEPHVSPYLAQINQLIRTPLQRRVDRKLRPIYNDYLLPTWNQISPQAYRAFVFIKDSIHSSAAFDRLTHLRTLYLHPVLEHVKTRYEDKLQPHLQIASTWTKRAYQIIRKSRLIKTIKVYLPHVNGFINEKLIKPIRLKVIPNLTKIHSEYIQPKMIKLGESTYQYLFIKDNLHFKHIFKSIKFTYRRKLLKPLKNLNALYVTPQIKKIVSKLAEYQSRSINNKNVSTNQKTHLNSSSKNRVEEPTPTTLVPDQLTGDSKESIVDAPSTSPSSSSSDPESEEKIDTLKTDESEKEKTDENEAETMESESQDETEWEEEEGEGEGEESETDIEDQDLDQQFSQLYDDVSDLKEEEESIKKTEELIVDPDELMDEIDEEIAKESSRDHQETRVKETEEERKKRERKSPEKILEERKRLEKLVQEGYEKMSKLKKTSQENFIEKINERRTRKKEEENYKEILNSNKEERKKEIEEQSKKLIEKLKKWIIKNESKEKISTIEKIKNLKIIKKKIKEKFKINFINPTIKILENYKLNFLNDELVILNESFESFFNFSNNLLSELGFGFTWLSDVNYHDWAIYNKLRSEIDSIKEEMKQFLLNPSSSTSSITFNNEEMKKILMPNFYLDLDLFQKEINQIFDNFENLVHLELAFYFNRLNDLLLKEEEEK